VVAANLLWLHRHYECYPACVIIHAPVVNVPACISQPQPSDPSNVPSTAPEDAHTDTPPDKGANKKRSKRLESVQQLEGVVASPNCGKDIIIQATAFNLEVRTGVMCSPHCVWLYCCTGRC
jgi:hypothetical protein